MRPLTERQTAALLRNSKARAAISDPPIQLFDIYTNNFDEKPIFSCVTNRKAFKFRDMIYCQTPAAYILPEEGERDRPRAQLSVLRQDNYNRKLFLQDMYKGCVICCIVSESSKEIIWRVKNGIENVEITRDATIFTLGTEYNFDRNCMRETFNPISAPGLF